MFGSALIIFLCLVISFVLLLQQYHASNVKAKAYSVKNQPERAITACTDKNFTTTITVGAIGDILIHDTVYKDAFKNGKFDFNPLFLHVQDLLKQPDVVTANQESTLGGIELGLSSYPIFNSPHEVANALVNAGIDIVSTANNHTLDKGEKGIDSEVDYLNQVGLPHVGSFENTMDQHTLRILQKNGVKLAFLSYTYGTNGIPIPSGKDYLVNLINRDKMKEEIHRAKKEADVVIVSVHWGLEYNRLPSNDQRNLAQFLADEGADVLFGSHPHVLQPMEWITANDGRKVFVVYSLGNFISGQSKNYKDLGGMATIQVTKKIVSGKTTIELTNPCFYPTYSASSQLKNYQVVPLEKADSFGLSNAKQIAAEIQEHMTQWLR